MNLDLRLHSTKKSLTISIVQAIEYTLFGDLIGKRIPDEIFDEIDSGSTATGQEVLWT